MTTAGRRRKRFLRFGFGLLLVPFSLWGLVVALAPMDWARGRVESALSQSVGHPVRLKAMRLSLLGGVRILGLEIGQPGETQELDQGPWLRADELRVDVSPLQLLAGRVEPTRCRARGVALRVLRDANGQLEIADLLGGESSPEPSQPSETRSEPSTTPLLLELANSRVLIIDVPTETRLELEAVQGQGEWGSDQIDLDELSGSLNGGWIALAAQLDRSEAEPAFGGELRVEGVGLEGTLGLLAMVMPSLAGPSRANPIEGQLDFKIRLNGYGDSSETIRESIRGKGLINLHDLALDQTHLFSELTRALQIPTQGRAGSIAGHFQIAEQRVATRDLTLHAGSLPIRMSGWTNFEGHFDYRLRTDELGSRASALASRLPAEYRETLGDLPDALGRVSLLRLQGSPEGLRVSADGVDLDDLVRKATNRSEGLDASELRDLGRRIRGRILR